MISTLRSVATFAAKCRDALEDYRIYKLTRELQGNVVGSLVQVEERRRNNQPVLWKMAVPAEDCSPYLPFLKRSPSFKQRMADAFNPLLALLKKDAGLRMSVDTHMKVKSGFFGTGYRDYVIIKLESTQA